MGKPQPLTFNQKCADALSKLNYFSEDAIQERYYWRCGFGIAFLHLLERDELWRTKDISALFGIRVEIDDNLSPNMIELCSPHGMVTFTIE